MEFLIPGIIAGVPILIIVLIVLLQLAGGAAWLPFVRRWRDSQQVTAAGRQPTDRDEGISVMHAPRR